MKTYIAILSLLFIVTSCDAPQRTRLTNVDSNGYTDGNNNNTSGSLPSGTTGSSSGGTTGTSTGGTTGFESCDLSYKYHTVDTGHFGLCQSSSDETLFKFKVSLTSTSVRTCLIPTYKQDNGSSTYIGRPQCAYTEADKIIQGQLPKYSNHTSTPLKGVIVMKEPLLPQYFNCMQGYTNWPANVCPPSVISPYCAYWRGCSTGQKAGACDTEARNYMTQICNTFKSSYSNSYLDIRVKN